MKSYPCSSVCIRGPTFHSLGVARQCHDRRREPLGRNRLRPTLATSRYGADGVPAKSGFAKLGPAYGLTGHGRNGSGTKPGGPIGRRPGAKPGGQPPTNGGSGGIGLAGNGPPAANGRPGGPIAEFPAGPPWDCGWGPLVAQGGGPGGPQPCADTATGSAANPEKMAPVTRNRKTLCARIARPPAEAKQDLDRKH